VFGQQPGQLIYRGIWAANASKHDTFHLANSRLECTLCTEAKFTFFLCFYDRLVEIKKAYSTFYNPLKSAKQHGSLK